MEHKIYFELDRDCSMNVLYRIIEEIGIPELEVDGSIAFFLYLDKDDAEYFYREYGNYIVVAQDFDQENGGSYI